MILVKLQKWKLILPHIGLVILLIIYILVGAIVFYVVENPHETRIRREERELIEARNRKLAHELWEFADNSAVENYEQFETMAQIKIDQYLNDLYDRFDKTSYVATVFDETVADKQIWTFPAAVLFAATTLTTVGYGTPSPATSFGRMFCVIYGLFGIPLTLVTVADLAKFFGNFLQINYKRVKNMIKGKNNRKTSIENTTNAEIMLDLDVPMMWVFILLLLYPVIGAFCLSQWEKWSYFDSFYFCFISVFTIGFGDFSPSNERFYSLTILFVLVGLIITTMSVDLVASQYIDKVHYFGRKLGVARERARKAMTLMATNAVAVWHATQSLKLSWGSKFAKDQFESGAYAKPFVPRNDFNFRFVDAEPSYSKGFDTTSFLLNHPNTLSDISNDDDDLEFL